jgi:glycosyltransferase involved in cell wall biosynthesis
MRIGLFTDTYHPANNGVVLVVDVTRRELEKLGHEVFVFAPDGSLLSDKKKMPDDSHVVRLPALQYDMQLSVFFPPALLKKIRALKLDIIHYMTPAPVGLMAALAARKTGAVLVGQHTTDTYEFSKDYPAMAAGYIFGGLLGPLFVKFSGEQRKTFAKLYLWPMDSDETHEKWSQRLVAGLMTLLYANCDGVVAVSQKSANQLAKFGSRFGEELNLRIIPTGVDIMPPPKKSQVTAFRKKWHITATDEVVVNFGRMAEEKNLSLLIETLPYLLKKRPNAKLLLAGDYVYREKLEKIAAASPAAERIIFSGLYKRDEIPTICAAAKLYSFPSLKDNQALVLNEAASQGLPIVMCDEGVNEVFQDGENGLHAAADPQDFADKIAQILSDDALCAKFSARSRELAAGFSERQQTEKLVEFYRELLRKPIKT